MAGFQAVVLWHWLQVGTTPRWKLSFGGVWQARTELKAEGLSEPEIKARLHRDSLTVDVVKQWRKVHLPISLAFGVLALAHIIAILVLWGWK